MSKIIFSFCLIFASMAIVRVNANYCSTYFEDLKQIDSMRGYVNLIQSLPAAGKRVIYNQLQQECNKNYKGIKNRPLNWLEKQWYSKVWIMKLPTVLMNSRPAGRSKKLGEL